MFEKENMEQNIIDIDDLDTPIYRIYPKERFIELIKQEKNVLVNPKKWADPFENFFLKCELKASNGEIISLENLANKWYGQCWTKNRDSDAMWRIYSPKEEGIRAKTTVRKLFSSFYDNNDKFASLKYLIGAVRYIERADIESIIKSTTFMEVASGGQPQGFAKMLCIKRTEFQHENEVRLLFQDCGEHEGSGDIVKFDFDVKSIIDEVALDPRLGAYAFETTKHSLLECGLNIPIIQSDLYKITPREIYLE